MQHKYLPDELQYIMSAVVMNMNSKLMLRNNKLLSLVQQLKHNMIDQ